MSNTINPGLAPHNLGEAIERLRHKWAAIVAFGVLLMALGFASLVRDDSGYVCKSFCKNPVRSSVT